MNPRSASVIAVAAASLALAGCSTLADPNSNPSPVAMPSWPRVSCNVASAATVSAALGETVEAPQEVHNDPVTVCTYLQKAKSSAVVVRFQTAVDASVFAASKSGVMGGSQPPKDIPGFQDAAFSTTVTSGSTTSNTVSAWKGTIAITVTSTASIDTEKKLIQQLFSALPADGAKPSAT